MDEATDERDGGGLAKLAVGDEKADKKEDAGERIAGASAELKVRAGTTAASGR